MLPYLTTSIFSTTFYQIMKNISFSSNKYFENCFVKRDNSKAVKIFYCGSNLSFTPTNKFLANCIYKSFFKNQKISKLNRMDMNLKSNLFSVRDILKDYDKNELKEIKTKYPISILLFYYDFLRGISTKTLEKWYSKDIINECIGYKLSPFDEEKIKILYENYSYKLKILKNEFFNLNKEYYEEYYNKTYEDKIKKLQILKDKTEEKRKEIYELKNKTVKDLQKLKEVTYRDAYLDVEAIESVNI